MDNRPGSDYEKRFVLAEAIKSSQVPIDHLFNFIQNHFPINEWPWEDMLIPAGRTLKQCKEFFENSRLGSSVPSFQPQHQSQSLAQSPSPNLLVSNPNATSSGAKRKSDFGVYSTGPPVKRRQSSADPVAAARDIRPKPSNTGSPLSQPPFSTPEPKKRGRPSKKDVERKQQEAIARGDILPPASSMMSYQAPGEDGKVTGYAPILPAVVATPALRYAPYNPSPEAPIEKDLPDSAGSPGKRRRSKIPPRGSKTATKHPGESSFNVDPRVDAKIESEPTQATTSRATSETVPVASLLEVAKTFQSDLPVIATTLPTTIPLPAQQAPDA